MSIVEFRGGPITRRYLDRKPKWWLAGYIMDLFRIMEGQRPLPMVLHCPRCGLQHVDAPNPATGWTNPPHRSHLCHGCGCIWRPADVPTCGVREIATTGKADNWQPASAASLCVSAAEPVPDADPVREPHPPSPSAAGDSAPPPPPSPCIGAAATDRSAGR